MMAAGADLLRQEYQEVNAHLRANTTQFVNWFSFFLTFSFVAATIFLVAGAHGSGLRGFALVYGVPIAFLLLHVLAFVGILTFRRYIMAAHCKVEEIVKQMGETGGSPIPVRFCRWMTDLMAAGFVISYFAWFSLLFVR
jgi:hypothetical protein